MKKFIWFFFAIAISTNAQSGALELVNEMKPIVSWLAQDEAGVRAAAPVFREIREQVEIAKRHKKARDVTKSRYIFGRGAEGEQLMASVPALTILKPAEAIVLWLDSLMKDPMDSTVVLSEMAQAAPMTAVETLGSNLSTLNYWIESLNAHLSIDEYDELLRVYLERGVKDERNPRVDQWIPVEQTFIEALQKIRASGAKDVLRSNGADDPLTFGGQISELGELVRQISESVVDAEQAGYVVAALEALWRPLVGRADSSDPRLTQATKELFEVAKP